MNMHYWSRYAYVMSKRAWRQALKHGGKRSATILWARCIAALGLMFEAVVQLADLLGAPGIQEHVTALLDPKYVPVYLIGIAMISEIARRRTLISKD